MGDESEPSNHIRLLPIALKWIWKTLKSKYNMDSTCICICRMPAEVSEPFYQMPFFTAKSHSTPSPVSRHGFERSSCVLNLPPNSCNRFSLSRVSMAHSKTTGSQETFLQQVLCIIAVPIYKRVYGYSRRRACSEAAPLLWSNTLDSFPVLSLI